MALVLQIAAGVTIAKLIRPLFVMGIAYLCDQNDEYNRQFAKERISVRNYMGLL